MSKLNHYLTLSGELAAALEEGRPVVALESTIITHGMPYPENVETALAVEREVLEGGALPATIALLDGRIKLGLTAGEIDRIGREGPSVIKTSRRDMAYVLAQGLPGATTVAGTMIAAHLAGISFFATGGIGGVHRGAESTLDVSADLIELQKTPVAVVCSGAKSILDIGLTLEYLETGGVPVLGYGTDDLPAFYTRESGYKLHMRVDDPRAAARVFKASRDLGFLGGLVIANPIPPEAALEPAVIREAIDRALAQAEKEGIGGKELTPFLLERVVEETGGASLEANKALVLNNARLAAAIAAAYADLEKE